MVTKYGMSNLGLRTFSKEGDSEFMPSKDYSNDTEVVRIII